MAFLIVLLILHIAYSITPQQLQQELNNAISYPSIDSYTIPPGDYYFGPNNDFAIHNANDFTVISSSKSIFYLACNHIVTIYNCSNVIISNFYIDFDPPCFSQGIVNEYNQSEPSLIVTIDENYPLPDTSINPFFQSWSVTVIYWDENTKEMLPQQSYDMMVKSVALNHSPPFKYKIILKWMSNTPPKPNNLVTITPRVVDTFEVTDCGNMTFNNLTIYSASNIAVLESYGYGNNTYNEYRLIRKPNSSHLITSNADAFNSRSNLYGPTLRNSYLEFAGDDFVNIHNRFNILLQRINDYSLYIIDTMNGVTFKHVNKNDYIYFYEINTQKYLGFGIVEQCIKQDNKTLINEAKQTYTTLQNPPYSAGFGEDYRDYVVVYFVKFINKLSVNVTEYNLVEYDMNNGTVIENNHFHTGFCAMMKLKAKNSIARNNIMENTDRGILLLAEQSWLEGDMGLRNIILENNILKGCGNDTNCLIIQSNAVNITLYNNTIIN